MPSALPATAEDVASFTAMTRAQHESPSPLFTCHYSKYKSQSVKHHAAMRDDVDVRTQPPMPPLPRKTATCRAMPVKMIAHKITPKRKTIRRRCAAYHRQSDARMTRQHAAAMTCHHLQQYCRSTRAPMPHDAERPAKYFTPRSAFACCRCRADAPFCQETPPAERRATCLCHAINACYRRFTLTTPIC